jgi:hypothetical protein
MMFLLSQNLLLRMVTMSFFKSANTFVCYLQYTHDANIINKDDLPFSLGAIFVWLGEWMDGDTFFAKAIAQRSEDTVVAASQLYQPIHPNLTLAWLLIQKASAGTT